MLRVTPANIDLAFVNFARENFGDFLQSGVTSIGTQLSVARAGVDRASDIPKW